MRITVEFQSTTLQLSTSPQLSGSDGVRLTARGQSGSLEHVFTTWAEWAAFVRAVELASPMIAREP